MREIVDRILQEEQSARSKIESAETQSKDIILKAKEEASLIIHEAVVRAEAMADKNKKDAESNFLAEKNKILEESKKTVILARSQKEKNITEIAKDIFTRIITIKG